MPGTMKKALVVLASLSLAPTALAGYGVNAPFPGKVKLHKNASLIPYAVDIYSGSCGYWGVDTAVVGSLSWDVTIRTTGLVCNGSGSGSQNEVKHVFADGATFRQWHFAKNAYSYDRTCDRCIIGDEGGTGNVTSALSHLQYDRSGTMLTGWLSPDLVDGQSVSGSIGYLP